jgi:hypothetical protein
MKLTANVKGIRLEVYAGASSLKKYGVAGVVYAGKIEIIGGFGDGIKRQREKPPQGKIWLKDYNAAYWEVDSADLQGKLKNDL